MRCHGGRDGLPHGAANQECCIANREGTHPFARNAQAAPTGGNPMEAVPTLTPRSEAPLLTRQSEAAIPAAVEGVPHATIEG
jgi:hypothetical protein